MRRELVIAGVIFIPFAVLVALSLTGGAATEEPKRAVAPAPVIAAPEVRLPTVAVALDAGSAAAALVEVTRETVPREVLRAAQQCVDDQARDGRVEVHFTPTREGRFVDVRVATQDPYLAACLEDVFEEARWTVSPGATESFAPATYVFTQRR